MSFEEYEAMDQGQWEYRGSGPPWIIDEALEKFCKMMDLEDLSEARRQEIDDMLHKCRGRRYVLTIGFLRRERKVWGRQLMAVAQLKRHELWYGVEGYANSQKKLAVANEQMGD